MFNMLQSIRFFKFYLHSKVLVKALKASGLRGNYLVLYSDAFGREDR